MSQTLIKNKNDIIVLSALQLTALIFWNGKAKKSF